MEIDLPPLHYTISTILPHGFFILAGGAKVGKSWLAEQISYAVAGGGQFWGYQAIQSEAFEFALNLTKNPAVGTSSPVTNLLSMKRSGSYTLSLISSKQKNRTIGRRQPRSC